MGQTCCNLCSPADPNALVVDNGKSANLQAGAHISSKDLDPAVAESLKHCEKYVT